MPVVKTETAIPADDFRPSIAAEEALVQSVPTAPAEPARASVIDSIAAAIRVLGPSLMKGVIKRRPAAIRLADRFGADKTALSECLRLRSKYGHGPLTLRLPGRPHTLILSAEDAFAVLQSDTAKMSPATTEKRSALGQFEPRAVLLSVGKARDARRAANEAVLRPDCKTIPQPTDLLTPVEHEGHALVGDGLQPIDWDRFHTAWTRAVRAIVFGPNAADDHVLTEQLDSLRAAANWAFFFPDQRRKRDAFHDHLTQRLQDAAANSLAGRLMACPVSADTAPADQVAHWLFAADAGAIASFRCMAVLASIPGAMTEARAEAGPGQIERPFLRAAFCESLRLWPTTPMILRRAFREQATPLGRIPAGAEVIVFAPLLHRDQGDKNANKFSPQQWLDVEDPWPYIPFSTGPAACPARHLVPMLGAAFMAGVLRDGTVEPCHEDSQLTEPLPLALDHTALRLRPR